MTAATVSIHVGELLRREVDGDSELVYHTDSTTVLRNVANEQQHFHIFIAKRVQLIRNHLSPSQWKYVDSIENPADDASRGQDGLALVEGKPESEWPHQPLTMSQIPDDDPDVKRMTVASSNAVIIDQSASAKNKLINYFSEWHQLWRAIAMFLQVKKTLQIRLRNV